MTECEVCGQPPTRADFKGHGGMSCLRDGYERMKARAFDAATTLAAAEVTIEDEQAAHQETLALWRAAKAAREKAEATVKSLAVMLGWGNVPPQDVLERSLNALRERAEKAEAELAEARSDAAKLPMARQQRDEARALALREAAEICAEQAREEARRGASCEASTDLDGAVIHSRASFELRICETRIRALGPSSEAPRPTCPVCNEPHDPHASTHTCSEGSKPRSPNDRDPLPTHHETLAVLAGAYGRLEGHALLTHAVEVRGRDPVRVLCGRVKPENLADANAADPGAPPTCERCKARLAGRAKPAAGPPDAAAPDPLAKYAEDLRAFERRLVALSEKYGLDAPLPAPDPLAEAREALELAHPFVAEGDVHMTVNGHSRETILGMIASAIASPSSLPAQPGVKP